MAYIGKADQGLAAVEAKDYDGALQHLSAALAQSQNPAWLIARSKALVGLGRFQESLDDANLAWHKAYDRNNRRLLSEAQYRRGVAYLRLGQYANADACCVYSMRLIKGKPAVEKVDPAKERTDENGFYTVTLEEAKEEFKDPEMVGQKGDTSMAMGSSKEPPQAKEWRRAITLRTQILAAMGKRPSDDPARKLTTTLKPEVKGLADPTKEPETQKAAVVAPPAASPRLQDYQSDKTISVTIFSKGVNKETLVVDYLPTAVRLDSIVYPDGTQKPFRLDLWGEIALEGNKCTVTPNKVELSLVKKSPGKWPQVKSDRQEESPSETAARDEDELKVLEARKKAMLAAEDKGKEKENTKPSEPPAPVKPTGPSYPTSSKSGAKNWDAIADEEDDGKDESDINSFFKKLYKDANPDQQRAMMKSFTESNGTSLSTSWESVKDGKVPTQPPAGVEAKPYNQ